MKNEILKYKNRFFQLLESEIGDVKPLLNEQSLSSAPSFGLTPTSYQEPKQANPQTSSQTKENINPKNLKFGDGGKKDPNKAKEVSILQQKLINLGLLKTDNGKPTGYFGNKTQKALDTYNTKETITKEKSPEIVKKDETSTSGAFKSYFRKYFPNVTQMFFSRNLSSQDFTENQKKVLYNVILSAIKRGENPKVGSTQYEDYGKDIKEQLDTKQGASTFTTVVGSILPDDNFKMATTLGRFSYRLTPDGKYIVTDNYDFTKGTDYDKIKSSELKDKNYTEKLLYVMLKNNWTLYRAARFLAWLEHPQSKTDTEKITINVELNPQQLAQIKSMSNIDNLA